ncbi:MAG: NAD(P)/FAD-dependent oxidoreductase [Frankiales bacterium]|nr:NAD(P)/FAD-dependent oxidoreductase [Frankiales bacterium]
MEVDVVVVGGGPAGLSAALWVARYRRSVVVLDSQEYRSAATEHSHGYLGRDPQSPAELLARGREELLVYPTAAIAHERVDAIEVGPDELFTVGSYRAHRVVLATGVRDELPPDLEGFDEHYGASVFHCAACDGYEARDRDVVVLGWAEHLVGFATTLLNWARSVTVVTAGHSFEGDAFLRERLRDLGIELVEDKAVALQGRRGDLRCLTLGSGRELPASLVFFSIAHHPRTELAVSLGCELDEDGYVDVTECGLTSVPGVYAAGDLVPGLQLVQVAAASGVVAGVAAAQDFHGERGAPTSPEPAPDPELGTPGPA